MIDIPRLVVAGISSGSGKTTVTAALARAFTRRGLRVAVFKSGPDYLDPTYHERAARARSHNLDSWMMGREAVLATFASAAQGADLALIEGAMGLFDGVEPTSNEGSTAQIAHWLDAPVLLVVDASGMARTIAAVARGCMSFAPELRFAGVFPNRVGSRGHLDLLHAALAPLPALGGLPGEPALSFPERHLGLQAARENTRLDEQLDAWAARIEAWADLDAILAAARAAPPLPSVAEPATRASPVCRIGYALDAAFSFYYHDNLRRLRALGAELVPFSPIADAGLPEVDGLYLGGGYPELHAEALAANRPMREAVARFAASGRPVYAECGGLMYLCARIRLPDGSAWPMTGLFAAEAVMHPRLQALGYVEVSTAVPTILGPAGQRFRGHQFRYSELRGLPEAAPRAYEVDRRRTGAREMEGYLCGRNVLASYIHAHWASNPAIAANLIASCVHSA